MNGGIICLIIIISWFVKCAEVQMPSAPCFFLLSHKDKQKPNNDTDEKYTLSGYNKFYLTESIYPKNHLCNSP